MATRTETWPVPYLSKLEGNGVQPGQSVVIRGQVLAKETFEINLTSGPRVDSEPFSDIALHISVRPGEKAIVLNSYKGGQWAKEKREKNIFKEGEPFDIRIRAHDDKFEIFTNQKELCNFEHRHPLTSITHLFIKGAIELHGVNWGGKYYPVPYQAAIEGGFTPGKRLFISGIPELKKTKRFNVNLLAGKDIALHIGIRFDEKAVVRNSQQGGAWQSEEREGKFPFEKEKAFDLTVVNEPYAFQIFVDGKQFAAFAHRMEPRGVLGIQVEGEVELQGVHVK